MRESHVASSLRSRSANVNALTTAISKEHGWTPAAEIVKRAMLKYESPKKRSEVSQHVTIDRVSNRKLLFSI